MAHPQTIVEAEKAVIGSLLLRGARMADVAAVLQPSHFVDAYYAACYESLLAQHADGEMLDAIVMLDYLRNHSMHAKTKPNPAYGIADAMFFIDQITQPTDLHAVHYASMVAANGIRNQINTKSEMIANAADDDERETIVSEISELTTELRQLDSSKKYLATLQGKVQSYIDRIQANDQVLISTGLPQIDDAISGGVALGELVVIGARPSNGKTLAAMQMVEHMSSQGVRCLVISEEMSSDLLAERTLRHASERDSDTWRDAGAQSDLLRFDAGIYFHERETIYIAESCGTIKKVIQQIDRASSMGVRAVAVDYLQLIQGEGTRKYDQVSQVSTEMKKAARKHEMVLIVLCQLARPDKSRKLHKEFNRDQPRGVIPNKSDCRDSGRIEEDADVMIFLQWPHADNKRYQPSNEYFMYVAKNRNRETRFHEVRCTIDPRRQTLESEELMF